MQRLGFLFVLLLACGAAHSATPLPGDSIYQLDVQLVDQNGRARPLAARRGRPQVVTMFYSSCQMVCPMLLDSMAINWNALPPRARGKVDLLAVSFDPARDDVATLHAYAGKRRLDPKTWTLARAEPAQVRSLSNVLGLQYRQLPDGDFNHSSELILLDADGRIVARTERMGRRDQAFVDAIVRAAGGP